MKDLKADWRSWTGVERTAAVFIALGMSPGPAASRRRVVSGHCASCNRSRRIVREDADMSIVIGPILRRADGYGFDIWTAGKGMTRGYSYRRIEDAHYARKAEIKALARGRAVSAIVCQTLDEFIAKSTGYEMLAAA